MCWLLRRSRRSFPPSTSRDRPQVARGWYFDGGTRLNTPIKPALEFGAGRVVVIALNSLSPGPPQLAGEERPDALEGAGQILLGLLDDQLTADVLTLATINELTTPTADPTRGGKRQVPYIVVAPAERDAIGQCALRVFREHYSDPLHDRARSRGRPSLDQPDTRPRPALADQADLDLSNPRPPLIAQREQRPTERGLSAGSLQEEILDGLGCVAAHG